MDRINKLGRSLISYKSEYSKHYSPIVDDSLLIALETQLEKKLLTQDIFDMIINDSYPLESFEKFIANKREYAKSQKELLEEFEKVRAIVNESLNDLNFTEHIETESNTEINKISILRQYTITEEFIKLYFGLEDEDMPQIMKKKGFAEKFAVLRLTKVFKEIYSEMRQDTEFSQGFSRVYYNPDCSGFSVDYKYHLPVDFITKENIDAKIKKVRDTDRVVERKFIKKTGINFYNVKTVETNKDSLNISKNAPNNKFSEVEVTQEEQAKIKNESKEIEQVEVKNPEPIKVQKEQTSEQKNKTNEVHSEQKNKNNEQYSEQKKNPEQTKKKQEQKKEQPKPQEIKKSKISDDYLDSSINEAEDVMSAMEEISNMDISDDIGDFEGFIDANELNIPDDLEMPEDIDIEMNFDGLDDSDILSDVDEDI